MRYPLLLVSDPHFTSNARDEYRWGLWPWLRNECKQRGVNTLVWLGDLSNAKDFHPSSLVNRIALEVSETSKLVRQYFIPGNHEWFKRGEEFWRFLSLMGDNVHYFTQPSDDPVPHRDGPVARFLPFTKTPAADWRGFSFEDYDFVFMHQTVSGARSSNGEEMDGEDVPFETLTRAGFVYSGDIHVPQKIGKGFEYVGSPYHVHFGDAFRPRCVLLRSFKEREDLRFETISRVTLDVRDLDELVDDLLRLKERDQVKVRMRLSAAEKHEWSALRRKTMVLCKDAGVEVHALEMIVVADNGQPVGRRRIAAAQARSADPTADLLRYVTHEELGPEAFAAGLEVIEE